MKYIQIAIAEPTVRSLVRVLEWATSEFAGPHDAETQNDFNRAREFGAEISRAVLNERRAADSDAVNHPGHYGGDTPYEVIKVLVEWGLDKDALLFNTGKYIARAGKKTDDVLEDLKKAAFYLNYRIELLEGKRVR